MSFFRTSGSLKTVSIGDKIKVNERIKNLTTCNFTTVSEVDLNVTYNLLLPRTQSLFVLKVLQILVKM